MGALALFVALLSGCGSDEGGRGYGRIVWEGTPRVTTPELLPTDRVLIGTIRNDSLREVRVRAREVRVVDATGRRLEGNVRFLTGYLHQLRPPTRGSAPERLPEAEQRRLGVLATLRPGATAPMNASWRVPAGSKGAVRIELPGDGALAIPTRGS